MAGAGRRSRSAGRSRPSPTGAGPSRAGATRRRGSSSSGSHPRPTAATARAASSPVTAAATGCSRRCTGSGWRRRPTSDARGRRPAAGARPDGRRGPVRATGQRADTGRARHLRAVAGRRAGHGPAQRARPSWLSAASRGRRRSPASARLGHVLPKPRPRFGHGAEAVCSRGVHLLGSLPPEPAEHLHRPAHGGHARRGARPGGLVWPTSGRPYAGAMSAERDPHPRRRGRLRRHVHRSAAAASTAPRAAREEGRDHRRRPALLHDLPAVPARGGRRQRRAAPRRGAAAPGRSTSARSLTGHVIGIDPDRTDGARAADPMARPTTCLRPARHGARLRRAHPADPRPRRDGHRLQAGRGSHRAAQPRAGPARHRRVRTDHAAAPRAAHLRLRRRRLRRHRGARRARGHGALRDPLLPATCPRATCGSCWSRRPAGSCPRSARTWAATPSTSCASAVSTCGSTRGWSRASAVTSCSPTARSSTPTTLVWTAGVKANPVLARTGLPLDEKGRVKCRTDLQRRGRARACGPPATAPPCPTSPTRAS